MEILDKYKDIITRIEEMCTSTAAMAPYPTGGVSVTTIHSRGRKGKSRKAMLNYKYTKQWGNKGMDITETINEIAVICEAIVKGEVISEDEFTKDRIKNNIKSFLGLEQKKHPNYFTRTAADLRAKRDKVDKIGDDIVKFSDRADRATGHRKEVNQQKTQDATREYAQANAEYKKSEGEVLGHGRKKTGSNREAHKMLDQMMESIAEMCEAIISEGNFEEAKQKFDVAKQEKQRAWDILAPRIDQISKYVRAGKKVPKLLDARYQRKYNAYKQAEQAEAQARKDFENS